MTGHSGDRPKSHHDKPRPAELDSGGSGRLAIRALAEEKPRLPKKNGA
jgi:hypothetical protein